MTRARAALAVAALLAAYALLRAVAAPPAPAVTLARPAAPPPGAAQERPPTAAEVREVLAALDAARAAGYADPAAADPDDWAARGCACRAVDGDRLRRLAARGLALRGHRSEVVGLRLVRAGPRSVTVVVTDRTAAYAAVDRRGRTVQRWAPSGARRWRVTLVRTAGRWVLGRVARAPPARRVADGRRG